MIGEKSNTPETNKKIKGNAFVPTEEGSSTLESLDAEGVTVKYEKGPTEYTEGFRGAPWSREDSLKFMCEEVGVNMDNLIAGIEQNKSDTEMAKELGVSEKTVQGLREHFMTHGLGSIEGQD
ncbi:MAG: hypothetical protein PWQ67_56 [Clostridia bacterium]|jgi:hypothetical protein|nr:hypothetical protein [Clostridia bacterium]MDN5321602.1 hypothetical protein [Clostridia bacterium]